MKGEVNGRRHKLAAGTLVTLFGIGTMVTSSGLLGFMSSKTEKFVLFSVQGTRKILLHIHSSKASIFFPFPFPHCAALASVCHCREYYGFSNFNFGSFLNIFQSGGFKL
jgi:hypothetical protein